MSRVFFRIVESNPPTILDFTSNAAKGMTLRNPTAETLRWWAGISVYDNQGDARSLARQRPQLGTFIAELLIPEGSTIRYERTGQRRGHYTLWGEPGLLLACVIAVRPV